MLDLISLRTPRSVKPGNLHHATAQCNSYAFFCVHLYMHVLWMDLAWFSLSTACFFFRMLHYLCVLGSEGYISTIKYTDHGYPWKLSTFASCTSSLHMSVVADFFSVLWYWWARPSCVVWVGGFSTTRKLGSQSCAVETSGPVTSEFPVKRDTQVIERALQ